jgi:hypothetical protein
VGRRSIFGSSFKEMLASMSYGGSDTLAKKRINAAGGVGSQTMFFTRKTTRIWAGGTMIKAGVSKKEQYVTMFDEYINRLYFLTNNE